MSQVSNPTPQTAQPVSADDLFGPLVLQLARSRFAAQGAGVTTWDTVGEDERAVHTSAARQILQEILASGYRISLPKDTVRDDPSASSPNLRLEGLVPEACRAQAERFLRSGEPLLAYNAVQEGLEKWPTDLRLRQLQSLALARSGAVGRANHNLQKLREEGYTDGETIGMLARTHKDLAMAADNPESRRVHLQAAFDLYDEAYRRALRQGDAAQAYYTGINAATLALLRGELETARATAREVRRLCEGELERKGGSDYWIHATLAEAALILGERSEAETQYAAAARAAGRRHGDLASTRKQARLLLAHTGEDHAWLARVLRIPPVLVFSGHLVRGGGVFPPQLEAAVRDEIRARLDRLRPVAAYGSAACGTDILCLEAARDLGAEVHVTLPFTPAEFRKQSVDVAPGWGARFDKLLAAADSVVVTSDHPTSGSLAGFEYANLVLTGAGRLRAEVLGTSLVGLAVWDGKASRGRGGTADVVALWRERGIAIEHVDVTELRAALAGGEPAPPAAAANARVAEEGLGPGMSYEIKAMLFADAVGFSKMTEDQIPIFIRTFMGAVGALNERTAYKPIHMQTSGDGLYFVFRDTKDAGHYALELNALVRSTDWTKLGLPASFDLRIGLHCGPIFCCEDPVTHTMLYTGSHTSRTARIEPITPPGQVYTSSAFAAVAAATGVDDLGFSYIGRIPLAKQYGSLALYHVQRPS
jgi:hypothetical protein